MIESATRDLQPQGISLARSIVQDIEIFTQTIGKNIATLIEHEDSLSTENITTKTLLY